MSKIVYNDSHNNLLATGLNVLNVFFDRTSPLKGPKKKKSKMFT